MNLKELREKGALVADDLIKREITWTHRVDGEEMVDTFSVFVRKASFGLVDRLVNDESIKSQATELIVECIRLGDDGSEKLTRKDVQALDPFLAHEMVMAVRSVNGVDDAEKN